MGAPVHFFAKQLSAFAADFLVEMGFVPRYVKIQNYTDLTNGGVHEWHEGMTQDYALYTASSSGIQTLLTSNGIRTFAGDVVPSTHATTGEFTQAELSIALTVGTSITVAAGSNLMTGIGTAFEAELIVGDEIIVNGERHIVETITSATVAYTQKAFAAAAVATSATRVSQHEPGIYVPVEATKIADNDVLYIVAWA